MAKQPTTLTEKALAAYEASPLKVEDLEESKSARNAIAKFLSQFGIEVEVDSNPFEIDGISLYAYIAQLATRKVAEIIASRKCPQCQAVLIIDAMKINRSIPVAKFGQWLAQPHLCQFKKPDKIGF